MHEGRTAFAFSRRTTLILGLAAAAVLLFAGYVKLTGGFEWRIAGLRIRSHAWERPAAIGAVLVFVVVFAARHRIPGMVRRTAAAAERLAPARPLALVATAWALAAGIVFSTNAAGGADASGYLNQARLLARGRLVDAWPLEATPPWPNGAHTLIPLGYTPSRDRTMAPTYPPGLPLLMAPAFLVHEPAAFLVVPLCGALAVWLTFLLGRQLGDSAAGAAGALLTSVSPTFLYQIVQPMSDVPVAAAWLLALWLALRSGAGTPRATGLAIASGLSAGLAILIRPNLAPLAGFVLAAAAVVPGSRSRRVLAAMAAMIPAVLLLAVIQAVRYGSPVGSGYGPAGALFAWTNVAPNLARYPRWLTETHTPLIWLWASAPVMAALNPGRWSRQTRYGVAVLWLFAAAVIAAYLPYVYFQEREWMYTRFLLPAIPVMWLVGSMIVTSALVRAPVVARAAVGLLLLAALIVASLYVARARFAFELKEGEQKYVRAGRFVSRLPERAVILSMQHSGSVRFYSGRPVLRWDFLDPRWLDRSIAWLREQGYAPFAVLDDAELEEVRLRFGPARQATLDRLVPVARVRETRIYEIR